MTDILKIKVHDDTDYDSNLCHDGGRYAFTTTYTRQGNGMYRVSYGTSADFPYCPCCGRFYTDECCEGNDDDYRYVTREEAIKAFDRANSNPDERIWGEIVTD